MDLHTKLVVVTGAGKGIVRAIAQVMAETEVQRYSMDGGMSARLY